MRLPSGLLKLDLLLRFNVMLQALQLVLGNVATAGSQLASSFSAMLRSNGLNATASVLSEIQVADDSIGDQIDALTRKHSSSDSRKHLGAIIGSTVGSGCALLILLAVFAAYGRGWLKSRRLRHQTATVPKVCFSIIALNNSNHRKQSICAARRNLFHMASSHCYPFHCQVRVWLLISYSLSTFIGNAGFYADTGLSACTHGTMHAC